MAIRAQFGLPPFQADRMGATVSATAPTYMPRGGGPMLGDYGPVGDPVTGKRGKSIQTQHLGSVVGRRGAGISQITGGDQGAHSINHYGKGGLPAFKAGGDF